MNASLDTYSESSRDYCVERRHMLFEESTTSNQTAFVIVHLLHPWSTAIGGRNYSSANLSLRSSSQSPSSREPSRRSAKLV
jgi:hypothetical protein